MSDGYGRSAASPITREQTVRLIVRTCLEEGVTDERQIAYVLATAEHESQNFTSPEESSGRKQAAEIGYKGGEREGHGSGEEYFGRGYAHLTHLDNYRRLSEELGRGDELVDSPALAANPEVASQVLVVGMRDGLFTGRRLGHYITSDEADYLNARRIVNSTDRAADIAELARNWEPGIANLVTSVRREGVDLTPLPEARRADAPLQRGDANARTFELQQYLATLNMTGAAGQRLSPDGDFGRSTEQAVRNYQRTAEVPTTGTVDQALFDRIRGDVLRTNPDFRLKTIMDLYGPLNDGVLGPRERGDAVAELQEQLQGLGFRGGNGRPLNISHSYDNATQEAVRRFQDGAGIAPANGLADGRTRDAINAGAVERGLQEATEVMRRRELQGAQQPRREQEQGQRADGRQGMLYEPPGQLDESLTDRYLAAVMSGDSASADRAATEFARSAEGRRMEAEGERLLAQHQATEQGQAQDRQMAR